MSDHYSTLGVSRDATPPVVTIAYEGRMKRLAASGRPEAERAAEERELRAAFVTLSNPAKKAWYDRTLEEAQERHERAGRSRGLLMAVVGVVAIAVLAGGYAWHSRVQAREAARLQAEIASAERERAAMAADADRARAEAEAARQTQVIDYMKERDQGDRDLAREHLQDNRTDRARVDQQRQQVIDMAAQRERQRAVDVDRRRADEDLRKARAEADRQARWVKQREAEEERARLLRAQRSR